LRDLRPALLATTQVMMSDATSVNFGAAEGGMSWRETFVVIGSALLVAAALSGGFALLAHTGWFP
jgi:hypothetical protein